MKRLMTDRLSMIAVAAFVAACASGPKPTAAVAPAVAPANADSSLEQLGAALATAERDSAADQLALDSLHQRASADSAGAPAR
ncbi:MAG: hypothetical protein Q8Q14_09940, partial [Gemmatimonadales bacterium]|nr:hypothetical protein [Gemmatimonadales bacterium]